MIESEDGWSCTCCGAPAEMKFGAWSFGEQVEAARCQKHLRSNPCAALGCKHTRIAKGRLNETSFLCRDHWREVCPPHSRIRKSWRRFFRLAKKMGLKPTDRWPEPLESRYWRFWFGLIKRARAQRSEPMDVDVINKMFGWDVEPRT